MTATNGRQARAMCDEKAYTVKQIPEIPHAARSTIFCALRVWFWSA